MRLRGNEHGIALGVVLMMALIFGAVAAGALMLSASRSQTSGLQAHRLKAQYAAEAGLVFAMQRLWKDPAYCGNPDPPVLNGLNVDVTVSNCGSGNTHTVSAKVTY